VVLDLGLQIEDAQGTGWSEAEEGLACRHVDKQADQEIAFPHLGCAAEHQHAARRQKPRGNDVGRHGARVVEEGAQAMRR
jgi:hypothetical protein